MLLVPQPRLFSVLPWTRALRLNVDRGKPFAPPARGGWYAPARSPARQRRGSGQFHCPPGGVRLLRGFPLCVTGAPAVRPAAIPALGCPLSRDTRSILVTAILRCPLSRDTPSIPRCPLSGYPLYSGGDVFHVEIPPLFRGNPSIPGHLLFRSIRHPGVPSVPGCSLFRDTRSVPRCPPSRGTCSAHGHARLHLKPFKISPNDGVSRVSGAALPSQSRPGSSD